MTERNENITGGQKENELVLRDGTSFHLIPGIGEVRTDLIHEGELIKRMSPDEQVAALNSFANQVRESGGELVTVFPITSIRERSSGSSKIGTYVENRFVAMVKKE